MQSVVKLIDEKYGGSLRAASRGEGVARSTLQDRMHKEKAAKSAVEHITRPRVAKPKRGQIKRYIFSCAVRGAMAHKDFLSNLEAYAKHVGAELVVGPLTNNSRMRYSEMTEQEFDPLVAVYLSDDPILIGSRVRYSPEMNLLASMVKPLQGLQTYTKAAHGIFPHTKISMETVATHKHTPTKFNYTTGACTHPMYNPNKAGLRAHFDHVYGALIVEVSDKGQWVRQLTPKSDTDGTFYDLGYKVSGGGVMRHAGVQAIIYGDIHVEKLDGPVARATWKYLDIPHEDGWKYDSLVEVCRPKTQVFHDLMEISAANHHELDDLFRQYDRYVQDKACVTTDFYYALYFLEHVTPLAKENIVVDSNHDHFIHKWLLKWDPSKARDFRNIHVYYQLKLAVLDAIRLREPYSVLKVALDSIVKEHGSDKRHDYGKYVAKARWLHPDESFEIDKIECGYHGHVGANGSRGSRATWKFVSEKSTTAHTHSPSIDSGSHIVGTSSRLDLGYNKGPSSWAHTHGIIYPHGGRAMVTLSDGKLWADQGEISQRAAQ